MATPSNNFNFSTADFCFLLLFFFLYHFCLVGSEQRGCGVFKNTKITLSKNSVPDSDLDATQSARIAICLLLYLWVANSGYAIYLRIVYLLAKNTAPDRYMRNVTCITIYCNAGRQTAIIHTSCCHLAGVHKFVIVRYWGRGLRSDGC